ncbi:unnamed protein product [Vitrella brassicaformis CCMP3155]|uniref:Uncharacterized protein n=1 Tax=Vitrella brassicaformis (strain CCMP3155) TaxID=1169540 RepID=A0A0G4FQ82_VITBC|nr:unnamed protein product [Vitrella brassicaformis CCMP3155]|eukprot:CEM16599.1 unnamed protein product [Vitrella brassicaformis CCMP3155]
MGSLLSCRCFLALLFGSRVDACKPAHSRLLIHHCSSAPPPSLRRGRSHSPLSPAAPSPLTRPSVPSPTLRRPALAAHDRCSRNGWSWWRAAASAEDHFPSVSQPGHPPISSSRIWSRSTPFTREGFAGKGDSSFEPIRLIVQRPPSSERPRFVGLPLGFPFGPVYF